MKTETRMFYWYFIDTHMMPDKIFQNNSITPYVRSENTYKASCMKTTSNSANSLDYYYLNSQQFVLLLLLS